jgi:hypothetical protein
MVGEHEDHVVCNCRDYCRRFNDDNRHRRYVYCSHDCLQDDHVHQLQTQISASGFNRMLKKAKTKVVEFAKNTDKKPKSVSETENLIFDQRVMPPPEGGKTQFDAWNEDRDKSHRDANGKLISPDYKILIHPINREKKQLSIHVIKMETYGKPAALFSFNTSELNKAWDNPSTIIEKSKPFNTIADMRVEARISKINAWENVKNPSSLPGSASPRQGSWAGSLSERSSRDGDDDESASTGGLKYESKFNYNFDLEVRVFQQVKLR